MGSQSLRVDNLTKCYPGFQVNVSFSIAAGQTMALVGPNGSGKTTIIYALLNIVRRDQGEVSFFGQDLNQHESAIKKRIGIALDESSMFEDLTADNLLSFHGSFYPTWDSQYASRMMKDLAVEPHKRYKDLSRGTKKKLALIVALAPKPDLLILDEPSSGLDPGMRRLFVNLIREARSHFSPAILLTSHLLKDIEELANQVAFLQNGEIALEESMQNLRQWRIIEGVSDQPPQSTGCKMKLSSEGNKTRFTLLVNSNPSALINQLQQQQVKITAVFQPDLEEIYHWVITPQEHLSTFGQR